MVTRCKTCDKPLALQKTAWASRDGMFCTHKCGVEDAKKLYKPEEYKTLLCLLAKATSYFDDTAEEISREDYGAVVEYFTAYSEEYDICTVFEQVLEGTDIICQTVVGWYYGEQNPEHDKEAIEAGLTAVFVD